VLGDILGLSDTELTELASARIIGDEPLEDHERHG
jgi:hypothetical protein